MPQTLKLPSLKDLLEAGVHFSHRRERSHPRARQFSFTIRDGVYIINLEQTVALLQSALEYLKNARAQGKTILFVGTKNQYQDLVEQTAQALGSPYVNNRWLGGTLTNFGQIRATAKKLTELQQLTKDKKFEEYTKKERLEVQRQIDDLHKRYYGIRDLAQLPDALFVVDPKQESTAVREAKSLNIPVIAIFDTTANPELIDIPIPANDDSRKSVELILRTITEALITKTSKEDETRVNKTKVAKTAKSARKTVKKVKTQKTKVQVKS